MYQKRRDYGLQQKIFQLTSHYDTIIHRYLSLRLETRNMLKNHTTTSENHQKTELRYGENPHQKAELWADSNLTHSLAQAKPLQGKAMSYNNYVDANAALDCIRCWTSDQPACVIIKHATPCGIAIAKNCETAFIKALATDPVSAFGGIVAVNQTLNLATAKQLQPLFLKF